MGSARSPQCCFAHSVQGTSAQGGSPCSEAGRATGGIYDPAASKHKEQRHYQVCGGQCWVMAEGGAAIHTVRERFSPLHHRPPRCWEPADPTGAAGRERVGFRKSTSVATVIFAQCKSPRSLLRETAPQQHLKKSALWLRTALPHADLQTHRGLQGTETFITRTQKVQITELGQKLLAPSRKTRCPPCL